MQYIENQEIEDGFQLLKSSSFVAAGAKLRLLADNGNKLAQSYLVDVYTYGGDDVNSKDSEALYWCVKVNQLAWYEKLFNKDTRMNLKLCELSFARENLSMALENKLSNNYYRDKFKSGVNWLIRLHSKGDRSTSKLFKGCNLGSYDKLDKYDIESYSCICNNFDWGDNKQPNCKNLEQINIVAAESK